MQKQNAILLITNKQTSYETQLQQNKHLHQRHYIQTIRFNCFHIHVLGNSFSYRTR